MFIPSVWYNTEFDTLGQMTIHFDDGHMVVLRIWRTETEFNPIAFQAADKTIEWITEKMLQHGWIPIGDL